MAFLITQLFEDNKDQSEAKSYVHKLNYYLDKNYITRIMNQNKHMHITVVRHKSVFD